MTVGMPDWASNIPAYDGIKRQGSTDLSRPFTQQQLQEYGKQALEQFLRRVVLAVVGSFIPGGGTAADQLMEWAAGLPNFADLWAAMGQSYEGDDPVLTNIQNLFGFLSSVLSSFNDFAVAVSVIFGKDSWEAIVEAAGDSPAVLWRTVFAKFASLISVGSLTDAPVNVLPAGSFPAGSLPSSEDWSLSTSLSGDGTFSAQVIADGKYHAFRSGQGPEDAFAVTPGQALAFSFDVGHQSVSWSGPILVFQMVPYTDGAAGDPVDIVSYTPTAGTVEKKGLSGSWTVPDGVTGAQTRCLILPAAEAGTIRVDNIFVDRKPLIKQGWVENLPDALQEGVDRTRLLLETLVGGLTGGQVPSGGTLGQLAEALLSIPFGNVNGVGGPSSIGGSFLGLLNQLVGGFTGRPDVSNVGLSDAFNAATQVGQWATQGAFAFDVLGIRDNTSLLSGFLPSSKTTMSLEKVGFGTAPLIDLTQSASVIAFERMELSSPLGVVSWMGKDLTGITAFYVNIWKMDDAGGIDLVHHSANIVGDVDNSGSEEWNFYDLAEPIDRSAKEVWAYELVVVGGGTYKVVGAQSWLPDHPRSNVVSLAATRNNTVSPDSPPSHINKGAITRSQYVPFIETAISAEPGSDVHAPLLLSASHAGTTPVPSWGNFVDVVLVGPGGGGGADGGGPGELAAVTWRRGEHFDGSTLLTFTPGTPGEGGMLGEAGEDGTAASVSIPGHALTAGGGQGGAALALIPTPGRSPGFYDLGGTVLKGGGEQTVLGADGTSPGGGAAARNPMFPLRRAGRGGPSGAWYRFRQAPIAGEAPLDVASPLPPTVSVVSVTHSTATITVTKASGDSVTVIGYNAYVDGVKRTATVSYDDTITIAGLPSGTTIEITATSVGTYANESSQSDPVEATTTAYVPGDDGPLSGPDQALVDSVMGNIVSSGRAWGASIAITGPTGAYRKAYGKAGPGAARDLSLDDHFRIGSNTKMFTARAILMELDRGHLALTDAVAEHIPPDYFGRRVPNDINITIEHLLCMRSGLAEYLGSLFLGLKLVFTPAAGYTETEHLDWIRRRGGNDYGQAPFPGFTYCNSNYIVLGQIVENVSGKPIKQYISEEILTPLGLSETSWPDDANMPEPYANGKFDSSNRPNKVWTVMNPGWGAAAGALVSTIGDMQKWGRELLDGTMLSPEAHDMALNRVYNVVGTPGLKPVLSGYGFANLSMGQWRGHGGSIPGYDTVCIVNPVTNTVVTAMQCYQEPGAPLYYRDLGVDLLPKLFPGSETLTSWPEFGAP